MIKITIYFNRGSSTSFPLDENLKKFISNKKWWRARLETEIADLSKKLSEILTKKDIEIDSPYNTYKYSGLPPQAICNPGYDSLYASFHPIESDYLYYITGKDNKMHYAKTLKQHQDNIRKYL